jgi:uncharacterized integral membrane protein (TIGR00698 family)
MLRKVLFFALAALTLVPLVTAPVALVAGLLFGLTLSNPFPVQTKTAQTWLLQLSVVGLGAAMNLSTVLRAGASGAVETAIGLAVTLALTFVLTRLLKTEATTSLLIGVGTAICGGSAIAAVAPAIGAKSHQTSVALAVVFLLNAVALLVFPPIGHALSLSQVDFGHWAALAIHDTSSVVGAALQYGEEALSLATTVKLARALWIIPLTLVLSRVWRREATEGAAAKPKRPWFILGFVAVAALVTWVPGLQDAGKLVALVARQLLVLTLFLVGVGVSRDSLRQTGLKPVLLGVVLWLTVATGSLLVIRQLG